MDIFSQLPHYEVSAPWMGSRVVVHVEEMERLIIINTHRSRSREQQKCTHPYLFNRGNKMVKTTYHSHKIITCPCIMPATFQRSFKITISLDSYIKLINRASNTI